MRCTHAAAHGAQILIQCDIAHARAHRIDSPGRLCGRCCLFLLADDGRLPEKARCRFEEVLITKQSSNDITRSLSFHFSNCIDVLPTSLVLAECEPLLRSLRAAAKYVYVSTSSIHRKKLD